MLFNYGLAQSAGAVEYDAPNVCHGDDTKRSNGEAPVMLELWAMQSTSSLSWLPGPLWPAVVTHEWVLSMSQIELKCVLMLN